MTYRNEESGLSFLVRQTTDGHRRNRLLSSSQSKDDTLPWYNPDNNTKHIKMTWGNAVVKLSEHNSQFRFDYEMDKSWYSKSVGKLSNGARYVLKFDPYERTQGGLGVEVTIYQYSDLFNTTEEHVSRELLEQLDATVIIVPLPTCI